VSAESADRASFALPWGSNPQTPGRGLRPLHPPPVVAFLGILRSLWVAVGLGADSIAFRGAVALGAVALGVMGVGPQGLRGL